MNRPAPAESRFASDSVDNAFFTDPLGAFGRPAGAIRDRFPSLAGRSTGRLLQGGQPFGGPEYFNLLGRHEVGRTPIEFLEMSGSQMLFERALTFVDFIENKAPVIVIGDDDVEPPASRLVLQGQVGIVHDQVAELGDVARPDDELHENDICAQRGAPSSFQ